ncbi:hypothetical protein N9D08_01180 [bacterium]|nr:hypothetical protein [bacterium]
MHSTLRRAKTAAWSSRGRVDVGRRDQIATDSNISPWTDRVRAPASATRVIVCGRGDAATARRTPSVELGQPYQSLRRDGS